MKKIITPLILALSLCVNMVAIPNTVHAQSCGSGDYVQRGKLSGLLALTNQDGTTVYDVVYVSDETWNDENPTDPTTLNFEVIYDENSGFSGLAWSETFGWLDFSYGSSDQARFTTVWDNQEAWGGWTGDVEGLNDISYSTNLGSFKGEAVSATSSGVYVGLVLNFDSASTTMAYEDDSQCQEYVDLFINNTNNLYKQNCPIATPTIKWTSQNIDSGTCVASGDLWNSTGTKSDENTSGESAAGPITESGTYASPQLIRLTCDGLSGAEIVATATARCGSTPCDPSDPACVLPPEGGVITPDFKEV